MKTLSAFPVLAVALLAGCQTLFTITPSEPINDQAAPEATKVAQPLTAGATEFLRKAELTLQADDLELLYDRVRRHPDLALAVLRGSAAADHSSLTLRQLAAQYDQIFGSQWQAVFADRAKRLEVYHAYDQQRAAQLQLMSKGDFAGACEINLIQHVPSRAPHAVRYDALHLQATATLQARRTEDALSLLGEPQKQAANAPHQTIELQLLFAEALRRAGKNTEAEEIWLLACAQLINAGEAICDPALWERLSAQRPVRVPWPNEVHTRMANLAGLPEKTDLATNRPNEDWTGEAAVWAGLGRMWLERYDGEPALLAFKRAEAVATHEASKARMRAAQGEAMVLLGQTHAANTILLPLMQHEDRIASSQALAIVGAVRLAQGYPSQGRKFLEEALQHGSSLNWIGRSDAQANLGLAYLMIGDESKGYATLKQAEAGFSSAKQIGRLRQLRDNEATYQEKRKQLAKPISAEANAKK